jgi:putative Holliday junction resolvase
LSKKAEVVICFDYGTKKIGACIGETYTGACSPLKVLKNDSTLVEGIKNLVDEWNPNFILVGMPSKPSTEFEKSVSNFIKTLKITFELKVLTANEDFTSAGIQANNKDAKSATLIFEDWFNLNYG